MSYNNQFRTFQTVLRYDDALLRHSQWIRWVTGITCPCLTADTGAPDPHCSVCKGRGKIYSTPGQFRILDEAAKHDGLGHVYTSKPYMAGTVTVKRHGVPLTLDPVQPVDRSYVQLALPFPKAYEVLSMDYLYTPDIAVADENSTVYGTNLLQVVVPLFTERGKSFEGSLKSVSRVYNVTRDKLYTVTSFMKVYIELAGMESWVSGDILEVDYVYQRPYPFLLTGISPKLRYTQPYVLENADATLVTPYWAQVSPDDLFTAMAVEQTGKVVINPNTGAGNDVITAYYDISRLLRAVDQTGHDYAVGSDVVIFGRNELKWLTGKPLTPYTAQFTYHPTYIALDQMHTLRNAENKAFVNRISVKQFDRVHDKVEY